MNDKINGMFEVVGGVLLLTNCLRLYLDKRLSGVNVLPTAFFMLWGIWNLHYYLALGQWASFAGGIVVVAANLIWVTMAVHYRKKEVQRLREKYANHVMPDKPFVMAGVLRHGEQLSAAECEDAMNEWMKIWG